MWASMLKSIYITIQTNVQWIKYAAMECCKVICSGLLHAFTVSSDAWDFIAGGECKPSVTELLSDVLIHWRFSLSI